MQECGLTWNTITNHAPDRQRWRSLVEALLPNHRARRGLSRHIWPWPN